MSIRFYRAGFPFNQTNNFILSICDSVCVCVCACSFPACRPPANQQPSMCLLVMKRQMVWVQSFQSLFQCPYRKLYTWKLVACVTAVCIYTSFFPLQTLLPFSWLARFPIPLAKTKANQSGGVILFRSTCPYLSDFPIMPAPFFFVYSSFYRDPFPECVSAWEADLILFWLPSQAEKYLRSTKV